MPVTVQGCVLVAAHDVNILDRIRPDPPQRRVFLMACNQFLQPQDLKPLFTDILLAVDLSLHPIAAYSSILVYIASNDYNHDN